MSVRGPLGFRAHIWKGEVTASPIHSDYTWPHPIGWAECGRECPRETEPQWDPYLQEKIYPLIPQEGCSCGIYHTLSKPVLKGYARKLGRVVFLVEGLGKGWIHVDPPGITSPGVQMIAVVNNSLNFQGFNEMANTRRINPHHQSMLLASKLYGIPVLDWDVSIEMARIRWDIHGEGTIELPSAAEIQEGK